MSAAGRPGRLIVVPLAGHPLLELQEHIPANGRPAAGLRPPVDLARTVPEQPLLRATQTMQPAKFYEYSLNSSQWSYGFIVGNQCHDRFHGSRDCSRQMEIDLTHQCVGVCC